MPSVTKGPAVGEPGRSGCLFVVATPLGNLEDITYRAVKTLAAVDLIAAEDTRRTRKLLSYYQVSKPLCSYHAQNAAGRGPELLARLQAGQNIALVSDAGTPGFSDPGAQLVAQAWDAGIPVVAIPGPAAAVAALSISGFSGEVLFVGFLPRKGQKRQEILESLAREPRVLIIYESPRRLQGTLQDLARTMPSRWVLVARELTKMFEDCRRGPLPEIAAALSQEEIKGECTLVLSNAALAAKAAPDAQTFVLQAAGGGKSARALAQEVAAALGISRRQAYQTILQLKAAGLLPPPTAGTLEE